MLFIREALGLAVSGKRHVSGPATQVVGMLPCPSQGNPRVESRHNHTCMHTYGQTHTCTLLYIHACVYVCLYIHMHYISMYICMCVEYVIEKASKYMLKNVCAYVCVCR